MSLRKLFAGLLVLILLSCAASAAHVKNDTGKSSNNSGARDQGEREDVNFPNAKDKNLYSEEEFKKFVNKLFNSGSDAFGDIPRGKALKVLSTNGYLDDNGKLVESGWSQIIADFEASNDFFESEDDRKQYDQENKDFAAGVRNSLPIHQKQIERLLKFAASRDGVDLSDNAQIVVPRGIIFWQNEGMTYPIAAFGALSYKSAESGQIIYASLEGEGFSSDIATEIPYKMTKYDSFGYFSVRNSD